MKNKVLEMKHIVKKFPGVTALNDVSFDAYEGEILALVGENGAGKSTLMKILSGFYPTSSYSGQIFINGQQVSFVNTKQSENSGIAMIYQELNMHDELSVAENIFLGHWRKNKYRAIDWKGMNREALHYINLVQMDVAPGEKLNTLNASQKQLISIAKALANNPRILVLDEPTASLSKGESDQLFKILHDLSKNSITSILISHKLDEVFQNADRIVVLRDSRVIDTHEAENADVDKIVSQMIGRELTNYYNKETIPLGKTVLEVKDFTVPYTYNKSKNIVENISFDVKKGEIFGLCGLVGSGRSELVNAIYGKMQKKSGILLLNGREVNITCPGDALKNGIALVTEDRKHDGLVGMLSIKENMTLSSLKAITRCNVINRKLERKKCKYYFDIFKIKAPEMGTLVQTLSGGNQQKVVLGRCLMTDPQILILDEPTRGIDIGTKHEIYKIMTELVKGGISIIMISSEMSELLSMCDRMMILANGKNVAIVNACEYTEEKVMKLVTNTAG